MLKLKSRSDSEGTLIGEGHTWRGSKKTQLHYRSGSDCNAKRKFTSSDQPTHISNYSYEYF